MPPPLPFHKYLQNSLGENYALLHNSLVICVRVYFTIVKLTAEDDSLGIVSTNWMNADEIWRKFPNVGNEMRKNKLLIARTIPEDWLDCPLQL